ncbi:SPOR domain-containing protein [Bartonella birtlesii]|uniref:SPOR domain-containing protein n=1 Tax=Bartonella birtlesii TaxID=111504 RepID=UPI00037452B4|nr:SPOR domain-containing protein [Bartonella birtlesii]
MSDNDRKNPHEIKQNHEHHDPLERLTRIFNPYKQSENRNDQSPTQTDQSVSHSSKALSPEISSYDDFDLSFLEAQLENDLTDDFPLNDQKKQWDLPSHTPDQTLDTTATSSHVKRKRFLSEEENSSPMCHDEEQILDALSPLPIPKNQSQRNKTTSTHTDSFFEKNDFSIQSEDFFFDETDKHAQKTALIKNAEQISPFSPTVSQEESTAHIQKDYDDNQSFYDTYVNHPYKVSVDQENQTYEYHTAPLLPSTDMLFSSSEFISEKEDTERNKITKDFTSALDSTERGKQSDLKGYPQEHRTSNYSQFYEEESLQQEAYVVSSEKYRNAQTQYINNAKNNSEQNNKKEVPYKQNNLNDTHVSSATPTIKQTGNFFAHNYTHRSTPPPKVDTYKLSEETVEKTGPIMVPEVPYEAPEYDVPTDGLKEEFADILNVGHISEERFSQQQQNEIFNEIFHQTTYNPRDCAYTNSQTQNASYFPTDNMDYNSSSLTENSLHRGIDEIPTHATTSHSKNFMVGKTLTRSAVILILIVIGFFGYSHFFTPPQKNEGTPIIHADNTPFKFKQETAETKNDVAHNLDIYKQATEQNEKQDNTQQFLIDNSEQPEKLSEIDQQEFTSSSSPSFGEAEVEDAVTEAINHTIPTREVQTVIVNQDGTIILESKHQPEKKNTDKEKEAIDQTTVEQFGDSFPATSHESDISNKETENDLTNDIDKIIAENASTSHVEEKVIPLPSYSHPTSPNQVASQNSEGYYVQLASQPTHALARDSLKKMQLKFAALIGTRPFNIQPALIPGKGTYYRVRIQTQSRNDAINLCESIKNSGGSCFITR